MSSENGAPASVTFASLGLAKPILAALAAQDYHTPTPIQAKAIPHVLAGRDLLGIAQTGTGKTAAFALPILHRLDAARRPAPRKGCRALILSPTRELASQIAQSFKDYGRGLGFSVGIVFGGVSIGNQMRVMSKGVDILVATPGRLIDLIDQNAVELGDVEILVLDEADHMLDMGFIHAIRRLARYIPVKRQTLFFSATMPEAIAELAGKYIKDPVEVSVAPVATTAERVEQSVIMIESRRKQVLLHKLLADRGIARALVFARTKHGADRIVRGLIAGGFSADAIHGNKSQAQRERALAAFRAGHTRLLVATDIAARGIDIDAVSHVINFDLPNVPESYVHRIGRTARAGAAGVAISFCAGDERAYLRDIERLTRAKVPLMQSPLSPEDSFTAPPEERVEPSMRRDGGRPGGQRSPSHRPESGRYEQRSSRPAPVADRAAPARSSEPRRDDRPHEPRAHENRAHEPRAHEPRAYDPRRTDTRRPDDRRPAERPSERSDARAPEGRRYEARPSAPQRPERRDDRGPAPSRNGAGAGRFQSGRRTER